MGWLKKAFKSVGKFVGGILGLDTGADKKLYDQQEKQLKQAQEARKLDSMNEVQNVVQIEAVGDTGDPVGSDVRRKKRKSGSVGSSLGLQV